MKQGITTYPAAIKRIIHTANNLDEMDTSLITTNYQKSAKM